MNVCERDAVTIGDAVRLLAGETVRDSRGRELTAPRQYSTNAVRPNGVEVWSYGSHFPLFHYVRPNGAYGPRRPLFLINGDRWPGSRTRTPDHQSATRRAIAETGVTSCVIPFNALAGAGIDLDSVRLLDARPDENWTETRTAETIAGVPVHERTVRYAVERTARELAEVPERERTTWRELTSAEVAERDADRANGNHYSYGYGAGDHGRAPLLPNAEGLYEWTEYRTRDVAPNPESGLYEWTVHVHRLGDCLISAVRPIIEPERPALPFEHETENARETVALEASGRRYCETAGAPYAHEAGPSGACIHCGLELTARVTWRRRARYLSSFDTNEPAPLYFLAEVPADAGETVATAIDSLAPRAVHAAIARGLAVERQGDIFLIPTPVDLAELERRGIRDRARLTMWTRDAKPRHGETGYSEPLRAADRRRQTKIAQRLYRRARAAYLAGANYPLEHAEHERRRQESRELWRELRANQQFETERANRAGVDLDSPESSPCARCGADVGETCTGYENGAGSPAYKADWLASHHRREPLATRHAGETIGLRRRTLQGRYRTEVAPLAPRSSAGVRARFTLIRERYGADLERANEGLRRAILAEPRRQNYYGQSDTERRRSSHILAVRSARETLERVLTRGPAGVDSNGNRSPAMARDSYRRAGFVSYAFHGSALELWRESLETAHERLRPELYGDRRERTRERIRRAVSIYGTAHSATEVVTLRSGAVYVRGTVRHVPALEPGRFGRPDHRPVYLGDGARWYLAVRNTVPRQSERRRRRRRTVQNV